MGKPRRTKSDHLLACFPPEAEVVVLTHHNPDPDGLASQLALAKLLSAKRNVRPTLGVSGIVRRAENVRMIDLCEISLVPASDIPWHDRTLSILVDTKPGAGNNALPPERQATAVIDHHASPARTGRVTFRDIRKDVGATATVLGQYLEEQEIPPDALLATALVYAIETETWRPGVVSSAADTRQFTRLYPLADVAKLAEIRNAHLPQAYFESFLLALRDSFIYDDVIFSLLPSVEQPDIVAEIADFLMRFQRVAWVFVFALHDRTLTLSGRTTGPGNVGKLLRKAVGTLGSAGGHETFAGAHIPLATGSQKELETVTNRLRSRILRALHIRKERGERLVARKDIIAKI
ncbi:MAG: DHH family phosphoesterase [Planctomycetota bacterium]